MAVEGGAARPVYITNNPPFMGGAAEPVVLMGADGVTPLAVVNSPLSAGQIAALGVQQSVAEGRAVASGTTHFSLPGVVASTGSTTALTAATVRYMPIVVYTTITIDQLAIEVTSAGAGGTTARLGIYNADTAWQPTTLVVDAGTVAVDANVVVTKAINVTLAPGRYLLAINTDGTPTLRCVRGAPSGSFINAALGASLLIAAMRTGQAYAAFPATGTAWTVAASAGTPIDYTVFPRVSVP